MPPKAGYNVKAFLKSVLLALPLAAALSATAAAAELEPFNSSGKWGFRERGTDAVQIPPIFDDARPFQDGLSLVLSGSRWGYVDRSGRIAVEPKYTEARPFAGGAAEARTPDGQWELLDRSGAVLLVSSAPALGRLSGGLALFARDGKFGYKDKQGQTAVEAEFAAAGAFSEELAPARLPGGKWGFIGKGGKFRVGAEFEAARGFSEGLAAFRRDGKWGYLDKKGRIAVKAAFHSALDFSGGLAAVRLNSWWGYIDTLGRIAICPEFAAARSFSGGLGAVAFPPPAGGPAPENRWIDSEGRTVYRGAGAAGDGLETIVSTAGKYGFARDGAPLYKPQFDAAAGCWGGACLVKKGGALVLADYGAQVVSSTTYDDGAALGCGLFRVRKDSFYGLINATGKVVVSTAYYSIDGSGCDAELQAVDFSSAAGRLSLPEGVFSAVPAVPPEPIVVISSRCLDAERALAGMHYTAIPGYCGATELGALVKTNPNCLNCRLALAEIYSSTDATGAPADAEAALRVLSDVIQVSSPADRPWLYKWRVGLLLSSPDTAAGALRALDDYRELLRLEAANPEHYRGICGAYALLAGPPPEGAQALYYCDSAVKNEPGAVKSLVNRANVKRLLGDISGAQDDLRAAIRQAPADSEPRVARARLSEALGQDYRVVFDCTKVLEADPANAAVLEDRAMAYLRMGICARVLPDLLAAGKLRPGPGNKHKAAAYYWACEKDLFRTLAAVEELLKLGQGPDGPYWSPGEYQRYLYDFLQSVPYQETLRRYQQPAPVSPVSTQPAAGQAPAAAQPAPGR